MKKKYIGNIKNQEHSRWGAKYRKIVVQNSPFPLLPERKDASAFTVLPRTFSPPDCLNIDFAGDSALMGSYTASC